MATVNTILYQPVELACWQRLRANALTAINWLPKYDTYHVYNVPTEQFDPDIIDAVEKEISAFVGYTVAVVESLIFQSRPNENPVIHVDGKDLNRDGASHVAFNVPLLNCQDSHMLWYDGEYSMAAYPTVSNPDVYSLGLHWTKGPNEVFCQEIASPCLVRVNVPHRVVNQQSQTRMMLSMRFSPTLDFSDQHPSYGF